jgi:hypothetical protein
MVLTPPIPHAHEDDQSINHFDFNRLLDNPHHNQDIHAMVLAGVHSNHTHAPPEIGIWQRAHDPRLNREAANLLEWLEASDIELLLKLYDQPVDLLRSVKAQLKTTLPHHCPYLETDIARQVLQFSASSRAKLVHFRFSSHGMPVASLSF